jgi:2-C-methyl-D-erythritol 4-phosphate cytidylyltransferase
MSLLSNPTDPAGSRPFAAVFSGGNGHRFGDAATPKQYRMVNGLPVICHVLIAIAKSRSIRDLVIGAAPEWHTFLQEHLGAETLQGLNAHIIDAGRTAHETRLNCLEWAEQNFDGNPVAVLVDAVRPLVLPADFDQAVEGAQSLGSAIASKPATETILINQASVKRIDSLPRSSLIVAAAPQAALLDVCLRVHRAVDGSKQVDEAIDLCSLLIASGIQPHFFETDHLNVKLTYEADLCIAAAVLQRRDA